MLFGNSASERFLIKNQRCLLKFTRYLWKTRFPSSNTDVDIPYSVDSVRIFTLSAIATKKQNQPVVSSLIVTVLNIQIELLGEICLDIYGDGFQLRDIILGNAYLHAFIKLNLLVIKSRKIKIDEMTLHNLHLKATCGVGWCILHVWFASWKICYNWAVIPTMTQEAKGTTYSLLVLTVNFIILFFLLQFSEG